MSILVDTFHIVSSSGNGRVGLDLGIKNLCTTSNGKTYKNPGRIKEYTKKLIKLQRRLSRKVVGSSSYKKLSLKVNKYYEKISNVRKDYLHKVSSELVNENQVIISENLRIRDMSKNHNLSKSIYNASWYELIRQIEYKSEWNSRKYIKVDSFYPSSQLCSVCGNKNPKLKDLSIREWICPKCGSIHDRDVNAAKNILTEGLKSI